MSSEIILKTDVEGLPLSVTKISAGIGDAKVGDTILTPIPFAGQIGAIQRQLRRDWPASRFSVETNTRNNELMVRITVLAPHPKPVTSRQFERRVAKSRTTRNP